MSKVSWLSVDPLSGSVNTIVFAQSNIENSGRKTRTTELRWRPVNAPAINDVCRTVNQKGKQEYVDIEDSVSFEKTDTIISICGTSNSAKLTFTLGSGNLDVILPETYLVNNVITVNNANIPGDPGAFATYNFSINIRIPQNDYIGPKARARQIIVTDEAGHQDICQINLIRENVYITVMDELVVLDSDGSVVSIPVESNTKWLVEMSDWEDGNGLYVSYDGDGDGDAAFSSDINEGLDREMPVSFMDESKIIIIEKVIKQYGLREIFTDITLTNDETFNVLKQDGLREIFTDIILTNDETFNVLKNNELQQ